MVNGRYYHVSNKQVEAPMRKNTYLFVILTLALLLGNGCSLRFPSVYRIDIPQGNLVDPDHIAEVKIGMKPRQVRYLLGSPLIMDTFNPNRWDYYYSVRKPKKTIIEHHFTIFFSEGRVVNIKDQLK